MKMVLNIVLLLLILDEAIKFILSTQSNSSVINAEVKQEEVVCNELKIKKSNITKIAKLYPLISSDIRYEVIVSKERFQDNIELFR